MKKTLCFLLTFVFAIGMFCPTVTVAEEPGYWIKNKLDVFIRDEYPAGSHFNESFDGGSQCYGFGKKVIYYLFGKASNGSYRTWKYDGQSSSMKQLGQLKKGNYSSANVKELLSSARPGDVLQLSDGKTSSGKIYWQHTMIVYSVNSDSVTIYDANRSSDPNLVQLEDLSYGHWNGWGNDVMTLLRSDNYDECDVYFENAPTQDLITFTVPTDPKYLAMESTDYDNAVVVTKLNKPAGVVVDETGVILYGPDGQEILNYSAPVTNVSASSTFFHVWWDFYNELGCLLRSGTTYTYKFQAKAGGQWYYGPTRTFTTLTKSYTVFFDANGGTVDTTEATVTPGSPYGSLPIPTREGYVFTGWYYQPDGNDRITEDTVVTAYGNHIIYAHWAEAGKAKVDIYISMNNPETGGTMDTLWDSVEVSDSSGVVDIPVYDGYYIDGVVTSGEVKQAVLSEDKSSIFFQVGGSGAIYLHYSQIDARTWDITVSTSASQCKSRVIMSQSSAVAGERVSVRLIEDYFYFPYDATVTDADGLQVATSSQREGVDLVYTFVMPDSPVSIYCEFGEMDWFCYGGDTCLSKNFIDVSTSDWFHSSVDFAVATGITNGTSATNFSPNALCTRGEIMTFLWRTNGSPEPISTVSPFVDVSPGAYYYEAVLWAVERGIANGTSATTFSPNADCTRGDAVTFLYRAAGKPVVLGHESFSDVQSDAYYSQAVIWAAENHIANGIGNGLFAPGEYCTRGQIVTLLRGYSMVALPYIRYQSGVI